MRYLVFHLISHTAAPFWIPSYPTFRFFPAYNRNASFPGFYLSEKSERLFRPFVYYINYIIISTTDHLENNTIYTRNFVFIVSTGWQNALLISSQIIQFLIGSLRRQSQFWILWLGIVLEDCCSKIIKKQMFCAFLLRIKIMVATDLTLHVK